MAIRGFSVKQPMNKRDRRTALVGWGMGAFVAVGAYVGSLQLQPAEPSMPLVANVPGGVDLIQTGSIGASPERFTALSHNAVPGMPLQAQINSIKIELAAMREMMAASQAGSISTNRRLQDIEESMSLVTASINRPADLMNTSTQQPLPEALPSASDIVIAQPSTEAAPRVVLPAPVDVEGGSISVTMRPMDVTGILRAPDEEASAQGSETDAVPADEVSDAELTTASIPPQEEAVPDDGIPDTTVVSQTPFAVDIGGAATLEGIDILWQERTDAYGDVLQGLMPRILLQQTSDGALDLRLVAGPIDDAADAAILCAQLVASGLQRCLPAIYDGQQLALR